jgi:glycosyltransferase involved in cell wall biosynthesis
MKIGLLCPSVYMSTTTYGGMIYAPRDLSTDLADGLMERGHEVTMFTSHDTKTRAAVVPGDEKLISGEYTDEKIRTLEPDRFKWASFYGQKWQYELDLTDRCYKMAREGKLDVIHSYTDLLAHYFDDASGVPTVYTLHDPLPSVKTDLRYWLYDKFRDHRYVSISDAFRRSSDLTLRYTDTVYHGIRSENFPFSDTASDYLLFMGRLVPEKGLHDAIDTALATGTMLEIGTSFPITNMSLCILRKRSNLFLENPLIGEPGMVSGSDKTLLYKQALALLFPIHWEEPFGMVMVEAMACGTPVIAYNRGSVPEIVRDGVTGFIIDENDDNRPGKGSGL